MYFRSVLVSIFIKKIFNRLVVKFGFRDFGVTVQMLKTTN